MEKSLTCWLNALNKSPISLACDDMKNYSKYHRIYFPTEMGNVSAVFLYILAAGACGFAFDESIKRGIDLSTFQIILPYAFMATIAAAVIISMAGVPIIYFLIFGFSPQIIVSGSQCFVKNSQLNENLTGEWTSMPISAIKDITARRGKILLIADTYYSPVHEIRFDVESSVGARSISFWLQKAIKEHSFSGQRIMYPLMAKSNVRMIASMIPEHLFRFTIAAAALIGLFLNEFSAEIFFHSIMFPLMPFSLFAAYCAYFGNPVDHFAIKTSTRMSPRNPALSARPSIFISYSHEDFFFARRLKLALADLSSDIWIDIDKIGLVENWAAHVDEALSGSQLFLLIASPGAISSKYVSGELKRISVTNPAANIIIVIVDADGYRCEIPSELHGHDTVRWRVAAPGVPDQLVEDIASLCGCHSSRRSKTQENFGNANKCCNVSIEGQWDIINEAVLLPSEYHRKSKERNNLYVDMISDVDNGKIFTIYGSNMLSVVCFYIMIFIFFRAFTSISGGAGIFMIIFIALQVLYATYRAVVPKPPILFSRDVLSVGDRKDRTIKFFRFSEGSDGISMLYKGGFGSVKVLKYWGMGRGALIAATMNGFLLASNRAASGVEIIGFSRVDREPLFPIPNFVATPAIDNLKLVGRYLLTILHKDISDSGDVHRRCGRDIFIGYVAFVLIVYFFVAALPYSAGFSAIAIFATLIGRAINRTARMIARKWNKRK